MTRGADRLLRHFAGNSLESAQQQERGRPIRRQMSNANAVYVYRHPINSSVESADSNWSLSMARQLGTATGQRLRPVGSIVRRSPRSAYGVNRIQRRKPSSSNPPSPPVDPSLEQSSNSNNSKKSKSPVPTISIANEGDFDKQPMGYSSQPSYAGKGPTTADELMKLLMEDDGTDRPVIFTIFEAANIDGVKHLSSKNRCTRYTWFVLIILFICLCFYQIGAQAVMYWLTPVATNIIAAYPESLAFPVIAICNKNQHRLTWLTGDTIQRVHPSIPPPNGFRRRLNESNVFDRALLNTWNQDAGWFLRNAAHLRGRMIVRCELPNGSRCSAKDFRPLWTLTGLCWAINTDPANPMEVTGAGPGNALRLLVNVERYERVESCTPKLRTRALPSLKVLIINQTDIPASYLEGVNVPTGFTMDIPFWMRHRQKLPGRDCVVMNSPKDGQRTPEEEEKARREREDLRSCLMSSYLGEIERRCNCSMRQAYLQKVDENSGKRQHGPCNVLQYFDCVQTVLEWAKNKGFNNFRQCPVPCESIDYTAWQDMNELPANIFPRVIGTDDHDEDDEDEEVNSEQMNSSEELGDSYDNGQQRLDMQGSEEIFGLNKHYQCAHNELLNGQQIRRIKRAAQVAFEKQAQFQEDIQLRTKRLIGQLKRSVKRLIAMRWGWHQEHFMGIHQRLTQRLSCYAEMPKRHVNVFNALANPKGEEERAQQLEELLLLGTNQTQPNNKSSRTTSNSTEKKTMEAVKRIFGAKADERHREMQLMREMSARIYSLFTADTFAKRLPSSLERMDKLLQWVEMYERGQLSRKAWAERMQTRNIRHFLEEDFYESWHNLITKDMEHHILGTIQKIEDMLPQLHREAMNGTAILTGSIILFGDVQRGSVHVEEWAEFLDDSLECIFNGIRNETAQVLKEFQRAMYELQATMVALFRKELPDYLHNLEFGPQFVKENFAQVNVFLHKMNIEYWRQEPTYSIWSFFCDIGATMSLFLGASMLTIIEVLYFVVQQSRIYRSISVWRQRKLTKEHNENNNNEGGEQMRKPSFVLV